MIGRTASRHEDRHVARPGPGEWLRCAAYAGQKHLQWKRRTPYCLIGSSNTRTDSVDGGSLQGELSASVHVPVLHRAIVCIGYFFVLYEQYKKLEGANGTGCTAKALALAGVRIRVERQARRCAARRDVGLSDPTGLKFKLLGWSSALQIYSRRVVLVEILTSERASAHKRRVKCWTHEGGGGPSRLCPFDHHRPSLQPGSV